MCGIYGLAFTNRVSDPVSINRRLLVAQQALRHRGPDDQGLEISYVSTNSDLQGAILALGHTRLSIIDVSSGGHQPMHSDNKRHTIVFNGEIYNYRELRQELESSGYSFKTESDTEVLLAAWTSWGLAGLKRLVGMFAFAVYDRADESLTLVRDAFGIKPLFYHYDAEGLRFASELPALLCLIENKPEIDLQKAYNYLIFGSYDDSEKTFYDGIKHLMPGCSLRIDLNSICVGTQERWWSPSIQERTDLSFKDAAAMLREMFLTNIQLHLRSDVPLGAALSGGIDSSAVVCAMRHLEPDIPIHTFSFVARGFSADEEKWIDIVNKHVGAIPHKVVVQPAELAEDFADMVCAQGEPFGSTSIYAQYRVYKAAREAGIVVILDGQGADEMLAGYHGYPDKYIRSLFDCGNYVEALKFLWNWQKLQDKGCKYAFLTLGSAILPPAFRDLARRVIGKNSILRWIEHPWLKVSEIKTAYPEHISTDKTANARRLVEHLRFVLTRSGLASLLRHGDRNSMRWSIESRLPFLTIQLVEFLLSLPESYLLSPKGETKHIFRYAMRGLVPDEILDRHDKIGFETPEREWLSSLVSRNQDWLAFEATSLPFFNVALIRNVLEKNNRSKHEQSAYVWRLLNLQAWLSIHSA